MNSMQTLSTTEDDAKNSGQRKRASIKSKKDRRKNELEQLEKASNNEQKRVEVDSMISVPKNDGELLRDNAESKESQQIDNDNSSNKNRAEKTLKKKPKKSNSSTKNDKQTNLNIDATKGDLDQKELPDATIKNDTSDSLPRNKKKSKKGKETKKDDENVEIKTAISEAKNNNEINDLEPLSTINNNDDGDNKSVDKSNKNERRKTAENRRMNINIPPNRKQSIKKDGQLKSELKGIKMVKKMLEKNVKKMNEDIVNKVS